VKADDRLSELADGVPTYRTASAISAAVRKTMASVRTTMTSVFRSDTLTEIAQGLEPGAQVVGVVARLEPDEEIRRVAVAPSLVHVGDREAEMVVLHVGERLAREALAVTTLPIATATVRNGASPAAGIWRPLDGDHRVALRELSCRP